VGPFLSLIWGGEVPRVAFCPAGWLRFVRQASNASSLRLTVSVRGIGDTGILTSEVSLCGFRDATPPVNTSSTPLMDHKTPISGECEASCPGGLVLPAAWPGVDAAVVLCDSIAHNEPSNRVRISLWGKIRKADLSV
jgi:hypothetical protein